MDDPSILSHSLKFLSYHRQIEYWNEDILQRGRLCQICELSHMPLKRCNLAKLRAKILLRGHPFSAYAKFSEKLTFLTP